MGGALMPDGTPGPRRRRLPVRVSIALPFILLALAGLLAAVIVVGPKDERAPATLLTRPTESTFTSVPDGDVSQVHAALHGLGETCAEDAVSRSQDAVDRDVSAVLDFARRHPDGRFQIDDENGSSLSLLLVLQDELSTCAPSLLPRVQELIPPQLRRAPGPAS